MTGRWGAGGRRSLIALAAGLGIVGAGFAFPGTAQAATVPDVVNLPGDLLIGEETQNAAPYEVKPGDSLTFTGRLNTQAVCDQINAVAAPYGSLISFVGLINVTSTFYTSLTVPDAFTLPSRDAIIANSTFTDNVLFQWNPAATVVEGNTVTYEMTLKKSYSRFTDLQADVCAVKSLDFTTPGVTVDSDAPAGTNLTTSGSVSGTFSGTGTAYGMALPFAFKWGMVQDAAGVDSEAVDPSLVTFTAIIPQYAVTYDFVLDGSGEKAGVTALPDEVLALLPTDDARYQTDATVEAAKSPAPGTVVTTTDTEGNTYTWTFLGWESDSIRVEKADVNFRGTWSVVKTAKAVEPPTPTTPTTPTTSATPTTSPVEKASTKALATTGASADAALATAGVLAAAAVSLVALKRRTR